MAMSAVPKEARKRPSSRTNRSPAGNSFPKIIVRNDIQKRWHGDNIVLDMGPGLPADNMLVRVRDHLNYRKRLVSQYDIKVKREVLKLAQLMLGLFCCSKTISYQ